MQKKPRFVLFVKNIVEVGITSVLDAPFLPRSSKNAIESRALKAGVAALISPSAPASPFQGMTDGAGFTKDFPKRLN